MKNTLTLISSALLLAACQQIDLGNNNTAMAPQDDTYSVKITSKSGDSNVDIPSPLTIYAVNADGLVEKRASVESGETVGSLRLRAGDYTLYAVAGAETDESEVLAENLVTANNGYFDSPVMQGTKAITVENDDMSTTISMSYAVASVDLTLSEIPNTVVSTTVKVETQYGNMDISREYTGATSATLDLTKQSDGTTWKSTTAYLFPGTSSKTKLTITHVMEDESTVSYSVNYNAALVAGTPYHFNGTYKDVNKTMEITCNIETEGWGTPIVSSFDFGNDTSGETTPPQYADGDYVVDVLPSSGSVWSGHVIACMNGNVGLLFSKNEWDGQRAKIEELQTISNAYVEENLNGWTVPTEEQITNIKSCYTTLPSAFSALNTAMENASGTKLKNMNDRWYLCENATKKYKFSTNISELSATDEKETSNYFYLRLVKEVTFKLKD